jgi:hypothetical protein
LTRGAGRKTGRDSIKPRGLSNSSSTVFSLIGYSFTKKLASAGRLSRKGGETA